VVGGFEVGLTGDVAGDVVGEGAMLFMALVLSVLGLSALADAFLVFWSLALHATSGTENNDNAAAAKAKCTKFLRTIPRHSTV
jgi:hypothetical protein